ncbi:lipid-binding SYLF domain-containing protein [Campylobacter sp. RM9344]|uniref:Lipid-binding SYLF domain-containing protein n=1 Tax=Campylobacter californiensis TaxID=1032243 RepID=A0AAW3ZYN8_9BACT|nr:MULTISPECIES: lipid-binding SYLF domain-containing protein [unclassified Campylobacter]MBE2985037.1 lipid-binding SYLF domain-containing protein [Campylobacter sp. RM6883]MBE2987204.1 lipid-binding SYLF domain-containing protein [Campylobacter sp. RM12919]MBE2988853.1 lipid-binding SYLF domain-containing protein [Campylobacter sp. RM12920]MBE2995639.1 lipid-binding SYLF domain-containing protein [Campylobacter sp. RM6913]MBE3023005.1 lipid-binding SYLF domain-containing protein [Campylobact
MKKILLLCFCLLFAFANEELVLNSANSFVKTMSSKPEVPTRELMEKSSAIVIFPSVKKVGFVVGGMGGDGVMLVGSLNSVSDLVPVSMSGGSVGLQLGYEDSSLVLFIMKNSIVEDIKSQKLALDATASFSFGARIGERVSKIGDFNFSSDIYAYATNDGFFAGASFGGVVIKRNNQNLKQSGYAYEQLMNIYTKF